MTFYLRNSILATIAYYDTLDRPLSLIEIYKYLVNPSRIMRVNGLGEINISHIYDELMRLEASGVLGQKNGFYFLPGKDTLYDLRIKRQKIADQKWKKFLKKIKFLALAPYLRGVFASGSMAVNNTDPESDFDVLIIAASGRLYTCRLFLWLISSFLGIRRKKFERVAPDKICFNHYITDNNLELVHQSIFNAQTYVNLKPAMISGELVDKFFHNNLWLNNYVYNFRIQKDFVRRNIKAPGFFVFLSKVGEGILNSRLGDRFEKLLCRFQQKKIKNDPVTYKPGGRIVFNDKELEFHPYSFEKTVIEKYNKNLKKLGVVPYIQETDSGLLTG